MKTPAGQWVVAALVGGGLLYVLVQTAFSVDDWRAMTPEQIAQREVPKTATRIGMDLIGVRTDAADQPDESLRTGMSGYLLPFEIVSVHLLVVLVGAAYLARTKRRKDQPVED
jgi:NADH:ubiquinone oxidoreductase subunit 6 (subunit J)